jgi:hypothetical protein
MDGTNCPVSPVLYGSAKELSTMSTSGLFAKNQRAYAKPSSRGTQQPARLPGRVIAQNVAPKVALPTGPAGRPVVVKIRRLRSSNGVAWTSLCSTAPTTCCRWTTR